MAYVIARATADGTVVEVESDVFYEQRGAFFAARSANVYTVCDTGTRWAVFELTVVQPAT